MPECHKIKKGGLDQYGTERFGRLILLQSQKNAGMKGLSVRWYTIRWMKKAQFILLSYLRNVKPTSQKNRGNYVWNRQILN